VATAPRKAPRELKTWVPALPRDGVIYDEGRMDKPLVLRPSAPGYKIRPNVCLLLAKAKASIGTCMILGRSPADRGGVVASTAATECT